MFQGLTTEQICLDSEDTLPFENNSKELVISNLWLHWVNDLPKLFKEVTILTLLFTFYAILLISTTLLLR